MTQPDRPAGRGHKLAPTPVSIAARDLGLPVVTPVKLRAFAAEVRAMGIERCVVASYGRIVPAALLEAAPLWLNVHPSLLPLYRGATPIQSAIRDGRPATALSIIAMDAGMDTGDLLAQHGPVEIGEGETYGELHDRLAALGAQVLAETLAADARGELRRVTQRERARELGITPAEIERTLTRPWTKADTVLPADATAAQLVDRIRALAPKPGATFTDVRAATGAPLPALKILRAHAIAELPVTGVPDVPGGSVVASNGRLFVRATDGWIAVDEVVPAGKRAMPIAAWANGSRLDDLFIAGEMFALDGPR